MKDRDLRQYASAAQYSTDAKPAVSLIHGRNGSFTFSSARAVLQSFACHRHRRQRERDIEGRESYGLALGGLIASLEERFRGGGENGTSIITRTTLCCFIALVRQSETIHLGIAYYMRCDLVGNVRDLRVVCLVSK